MTLQGTQRDAHRMLHGIFTDRGFDGATANEQADLVIALWHCSKRNGDIEVLLAEKRWQPAVGPLVEKVCDLFGDDALKREIAIKRWPRRRHWDCPAPPVPELVKAGRLRAEKRRDMRSWGIPPAAMHAYDHEQPAPDAPEYRFVMGNWVMDAEEDIRAWKAWGGRKPEKLESTPIFVKAWYACGENPELVNHYYEELLAGRAVPFLAPLGHEAEEGEGDHHTADHVRASPNLRTHSDLAIRREKAKKNADLRDVLKRTKVVKADIEVMREGLETGESKVGDLVTAETNAERAERERIEQQNESMLEDLRSPWMSADMGKITSQCLLDAGVPIETVLAAAEEGAKAREAAMAEAADVEEEKPAFSGTLFDRMPAGRPVLRDGMWVMEAGDGKSQIQNPKSKMGKGDGADGVDHAGDMKRRPRPRTDLSRSGAAGDGAADGDGALVNNGAADIERTRGQSPQASNDAEVATGDDVREGSIDSPARSDATCRAPEEADASHDARGCADNATSDEPPRVIKRRGQLNRRERRALERERERERERQRGRSQGRAGGKALGVLLWVMVALGLAMSAIAGGRATPPSESGGDRAVDVTAQPSQIINHQIANASPAASRSSLPLRTGVGWDRAVGMVPWQSAIENRKSPIFSLPGLPRDARWCLMTSLGAADVAATGWEKVLLMDRARNYWLRFGRSAREGVRGWLCFRGRGLAVVGIAVAAAINVGCRGPLDGPREAGLSQRLRTIELTEPQRWQTEEAVTVDEALAGRELHDPLAEARESEALSLAGVRLAVLTNNLGLKILRYDPTIAATRVSEEQAEFEATFFATATAERSEGQALFLGPPVELLVGQAEAGVRLPLKTGGSVAVSTDVTHSTLDLGNDPEQIESALTLSVSQPLLRNAGWQVNTAPIRVAELATQQATATARLGAIRLIADAERVYWRYYAAAHALEVRRESYRRAVEQLDQARRLADAGVVPRIEIARAEGGVARRVEAILVAETVRRSLERELKRVMNRDDLPITQPTVLTVETLPNPIRLAPKQDGLIEVALDRRMEMLQAELQLAIDAINVETAKNLRLPVFALAFEYSFAGIDDSLGGAYGDIHSDGFRRWQAGATLEVPLGNERAESQLRRAVLLRLQTLATKQQRALAIKQDVLNALDQLELSWERILAARQDALLAARIYQAEQRQFAVGSRTSTDVLEAADFLAEAQLREIAAMADYEVAKIEIAFATGTLLGHGQIEFEPAEMPRVE